MKRFVLIPSEEVNSAIQRHSRVIGENWISSRTMFSQAGLMLKELLTVERTEPPPSE